MILASMGFGFGLAYIIWRFDWAGALFILVVSVAHLIPTEPSGAESPLVLWAFIVGGVAGATGGYLDRPDVKFKRRFKRAVSEDPNPRIIP